MGGVSLRSDSDEAAGEAGGLGCGGGFSGVGRQRVCDRADDAGGWWNIYRGDARAGAGGADEIGFKAGRKEEFARWNTAREVSFARMVSERNIRGGFELDGWIICHGGCDSRVAQRIADLFCGRGGRAGDAVCDAGREVAAD